MIVTTPAAANGVEEHVLGALRAAPLQRAPFDHFFVENVFPAPFYAEIQRFLATPRAYAPRKFMNREFAEDARIPGLDFMRKPSFAKAILNLFPDAFMRDFGPGAVQVHRDVRLIRDSQHYKIGPHTDSPWKVVSLLFYLPPDDTHREHGTALFEPLDPAFRCAGGPHHPFPPFREVWRAPFIPNACLGFWKTDYSFHGVHPIPLPIQRDVLLFNIYRKDIFERLQPPLGAQGKPAWH